MTIRRPISRKYLPPRQVTITRADGTTETVAGTPTPRTAPKGWFANTDTYATWAPTAVSRITLLVDTRCERCTGTIVAGRRAVVATGASRRALYHPPCAKTLGYTTS
jgi:hypothetical protein